MVWGFEGDGKFRLQFDARFRGGDAACSAKNAQPEWQVEGCTVNAQREVDGEQAEVAPCDHLQQPLEASSPGQELVLHVTKWCTEGNNANREKKCSPQRHSAESRNQNVLQKPAKATKNTKRQTAEYAKYGEREDGEDATEFAAGHPVSVRIVPPHPGPLPWERESPLAAERKIFAAFDDFQTWHCRERKDDVNRDGRNSRRPKGREGGRVPGESVGPCGAWFFVASSGRAVLSLVHGSFAWISEDRQ